MNCTDMYVPDDGKPVTTTGAWLAEAQLRLDECKEAETVAGTQLVSSQAAVEKATHDLVKAQQKLTQANENLYADVHHSRTRKVERMQAEAEVQALRKQLDKERRQLLEEEHVNDGGSKPLGEGAL